MARPPKPLQQLGKGVRLAAPYGAALLLVLGLRASGIAETLNLLLYDLVTHLRPAPAGAATPITLIGTPYAAGAETPGMTAAGRTSRSIVR